MRSVPLGEHGVEWIQPPAPLAHPLDDGPAVVLERSLDGDGRRAGERRRRLAPAVRAARPGLRRARRGHPRRPAPAAASDPHGALRPLSAPFGRRARALEVRRRAGPGVVRRERRARDAASRGDGHGLVRARPGDARPLRSAGPCRAAARRRLPTRSPRTFGRSAGRSRRVARSPRSTRCAMPELVLLDVTPRQFLALAGDDVPSRYRRALEKYRYGPGVVKVDYALAGPVPWRAAELRARRDRAPRRHARRDRRCRGRGREAGGSRPAPTCSSPSRASSTPLVRPQGKHTLWAYTHVPNGSTLTDAAVDGDRGSARAVRARLPGSRPRPERARARSAGGSQPELRRRRHQRRQRRPAPAVRAPGGPSEPVPDADRRRLSLLVVDASRRRRARHVRVPRRPRRAAQVGRLPRAARGYSRVAWRSDTPTPPTTAA